MDLLTVLVAMLALAVGAALGALVMRQRVVALEQELRFEREDAEHRRAEAAQLHEDLQLRFENLANRIFDEKTQRFASQSNERLDGVLKPLREQLDGFRKRVEEVHSTDQQQRSALERHLKHLHELNQQMSAEAQNLTKALKGQSKVRGNWGEMILQQVLESSGLRHGEEYDTQRSLHPKDDPNKRFVPDAIIHLPDDRDVIVDAKVALVAWERVVAAADDDERQRALSEHLGAMRGHMKGLSDKNYADLEGIRSLDFVLMFVPIEPAYLAAVEHDAKLFQDAFDQKVLITSPSTLHAVLRTIDTLWRYERQNRHALEIADRAGKLYDKFANYVESLQKVGGALGQAQKAYDTAYNRLAEGPGNVVRQAELIRELGAKAQKALPDDLVERAAETPETD